jgi:hypothetical protein
MDRFSQPRMPADVWQQAAAQQIDVVVDGAQKRWKHGYRLPTQQELLVWLQNIPPVGSSNGPRDQVSTTRRPDYTSWNFDKFWMPVADAPNAWVLFFLTFRILIFRDVVVRFQ